MWRKISSKIALVIIIIFTIAACTGNNNGGTPTPTPTQGAQEVILIWWNVWETQENVQPLIDAYQALHPNVKIQYAQKGEADGVSGYKSSLDTVLTDSDPLNTPDIFTIHNTWVGKYEQYISPAPVNVISNDSLSDFYQVVKDDFVKSGSVKGLPLYMDALAMIYNKDKLIEAGYTTPSDDWSEFQNQAKNITKKNASGKIISAGFSANFPSNTEFYFDILNLLFLQNGVSMTDQAGTAATFASESQKTKAQDAVNFYREFTNGNKATWNQTFKKDIAAFLEKDLAMYAAPSWRLIDILNYNKQFGLNLNIGVEAMPQLSADESIGWSSYWGQTVSKESSNSATAWDFINFITQPDQLKLLNQEVLDNGRPFGILYPRSSMSNLITDDPQYKDLLSPYIQAFSRSKTWNMVDGFTVKNEFIKFGGGQNDLDALQSAVNEVFESKNQPPT